MFFMQCESFLDDQRHLQSRQGKSNAQSLFGLREIPSLAQIRNLLDGASATELFEVFFKVYEGLQRSGRLQPYEQWNGHLLVALDGTQYCQSQKIHCWPTSFGVNHLDCVILKNVANLTCGSLAQW